MTNYELSIHITHKNQFAWTIVGKIDGKPFHARGCANSHAEAHSAAMQHVAHGSAQPKQTTSDRTIYPPPYDNPDCICGSGLRSMYCKTGHMTECHYPMSCEQANCSHMDRYEKEIR